IPRGRKITAGELQLQLREAGHERDLRTIQRLLKALSEQYDMECDDSSKPFGYCWKEKSKGFALPVLNEHESLVLMLAKKHLQNLMPATVMKSMEGFFYQAQTNLGPAGEAWKAREWLQKTRVISETLPLLPPKLAPGVLEHVSSALYH